MSFVDGRYEHWPITNEYIKRTAGESGSPSFHGTATNFEEVALSMMPKLIYEKLVKGYTEKQWGVPAPSLSASLAKRFDIRSGEDVRLSRHRHQGLPVEGYHSWITNMLAGIYLLPNTDYTEMRSRFTHKRKLIFTGPIDEFFSFRAGRLKYRGQRRTHVYLPNTKYFQPFAQVNNPDQGSGPHIRTLEWKHIMEPGLAASTLGTVITTETPFSSGDPDNYEYPFPDESNHRLYLEYAGMASQLADVIICGRLGEYRYYDMDQAIARAMTIADHVLSGDISRFGQSRALKVLPTCCAATSN
ncbi:MAG TPA: UDP-galactopyranose mutase [Candidatus Limnocylindria bacterium]|nr:UDP-galactopyranose mutase [Candidatus Limnocylindria bacterium]